MGLRAGSTGTERKTWSRSLRGTILAGSSSSRAHDNDRLRLPPASPPRSSKTEKKESADRPLNQLCPPFATLSSNSSLDYRRTDASNADDGFAASPCVSESAKVVLFAISRGGGVAGRGPSALRVASGPQHSSAPPLDSRRRGPISHDTVRASCCTACADAV